MHQNFPRLPLIFGLGIITLTFLALGGTIYLFSQSDSVQEQTENKEEYVQNKDSSEQFASEKNILVTPLPPQNSGTAAIDPNSSTGIPIGKYSNPPTIVNSSDYSDVYGSNRPIEDFESSVELNRLSQERSNENIDLAIPDYSSPSSSNNFSNNNGNSLIESDIESNLLESPNSRIEETIESSPVEEPIF